jgi:hypothetical protein
MSAHLIIEFVRESNRIEGIRRDPTMNEVVCTELFLECSRLTVSALCSLVSAYQPGAKLRRWPGMDVRVGSYYPPKGGTHIEAELIKILDQANNPEMSAYGVHLAYEGLHPFMDGNGRSGRAIWLWQMLRAGPGAEDQALGLGFLHTFYYQTLAASGHRFGDLPR